MPCLLIVNADDFGLTPGINRAIEELHQAGALTSATLMATGPAFDDAVATALRNPALGVGCHIVLVDGTPVSPPASIPTLIGRDHRTFRPTLLGFAQAVLRGAIDPDDLYREASAQVTKLRQAGIPILHLDTHKHTHLFPQVTQILLQVCEDYGIAAIRNPFEPARALALGQGSLLRRLQMRILDRAFHRAFSAAIQARPAVATTQGSLGVSTTGHLTRETLTQLIKTLPSAEAWELITHPGYQDAALATTATRLRASRDMERLALHACIPILRTNPQASELIHYGALAPPTTKS